jgi:outer membrane murein-binding lipoprotein Lpp
LSALTKILIILISLLSIFLCAVASTYVGTSVNWKQKATSLAGDVATLETENTALRSDSDSMKQAMQANHKKFQDTVEQKNRENRELKTELTTEKRNALESDRDRGKLLAELTALRTTIQNMDTSLQITQKALALARNEGVDNQKELTQLTDKLLEQVVQIQNLQVQFKRLLEEKSILENKFATSGTTVPKGTPVTQDVGKALPADPLLVAPRGGLKGLVIGVQGSLATVSIGAADGVKKKDVLQVYRGSEFICEISITDVDTNKAAGILELVQQGGPKIGDTVTSEL